MAICARTRADVERVAREIAARSGHEVVPFVADMTKGEDIDALMAEVRARLGDPDIVVGNAGGPPAGIGGDKVSVYTATTGAQDPHQIQARPSLIAKARGADVAVCTGAELEIGWLPMIAQQSANPKLQQGQTGLFRGVELRAAARSCRRGSTAPRATCTRPAIRTSRPIRGTY